MATLSINHNLLSTPLFLLLLLFVLLSCHRANSTPVPRAGRRALRANSTAVIAQFLKAHNTVRSVHGLSRLKWSTSLANYAKRHAKRRRGDCALIHSTGDYGENLFWGSGKRWKAADAVGAWAAEGACYDYKTNSCTGGSDCLHYTQLVWKSTSQLGCAQIVCNSGDTFVACEYYPHGNVIGEKPY